MQAQLRSIIVTAASALAVLSSACSRPEPRPAPTPVHAPAGSDYASPPRPVAASRAPGGEIVLSGYGGPDAVIRLASPDGTAIGATTGRDGAWALATPVSDQPRLYSLSQDVNGRPLRAAGYIAALPAPGPAAGILHAGAGAQVLAAPTRSLTITAVDFDGAGAAVVSGRSAPQAAVRVTIDGVEAGEDRADGAGAFTAAVSQTLRPGPHVIVATVGPERAEARFDALLIHTIPTPPFQASRVASGWRIDWTTPGGGVQTTLLFDIEGPAQ